MGRSSDWAIQGAPMGAPDPESRLPHHAMGPPSGVGEPFADTPPPRSRVHQAQLAAASRSGRLCVVGGRRRHPSRDGRPAYSRAGKRGVSFRYTAPSIPTPCRTWPRGQASRRVSVVDVTRQRGGPPGPRAPCWSWSAVTRTSSADPTDFQPRTATHIHLAPSSDKITKCSTTCCSPPTWRRPEPRSHGEATRCCSAEPAESSPRVGEQAMRWVALPRSAAAWNVLKQVASGLLHKDVSLVAEHRREGRRRPGAGSRCRRTRRCTGWTIRGRTEVRTGPTTV